MAALLTLFALWCGISWRWYTCGIHGFCGNAAHTPALIPMAELAGKTAEASEGAEVACADYLPSPVRDNTAKESEVRRLERYLQSRHGELLAEDGIFGPHDRAAVKRYQRAHLLPTSGEVAGDTLARINDDVCASPLPITP